MIIVKLNGGLGNQMFQYALGRRISYLNNIPLKLDINIFDLKQLRRYELYHFNIQETFATKDEIAKYKNTLLRDYFIKFIKKSNIAFIKNNLHFLQRSHITEKDFSFDPNIKSISNDVYLDGYWQSEKYFEDIKEIIRQDFNPKYMLDDINMEYKNLIKRSNSVSIHIRRGDYVLNPKINIKHGTCSLEYYQQAIEFVTKQVPDPHFFIFSDDIDWVRCNLKLTYPMHIIDNNKEEDSYKDMILMSMCSHNIIANSSFSWWGAWLNQNQNKIVIAPERWFMDGNSNTADLIPEKWIMI